MGSFVLGSRLIVSNDTISSISRGEANLENGNNLYIFPLNINLQVDNMKIVHIFGGALYAVHYEEAEDNEYDRLMDLWSDVVYLREYLKNCAVKEVKQLANKISDDQELIEDLMIEVEEGERNLDMFFRPLYNSETGFRELSLQKGRPHQKSYLRLYAIRIDSDCYLITGGAIKLVPKMQDDPNLMEELKKLKAVKNYLKVEGVFDQDSFEDLKEE